MSGPLREGGSDEFVGEDVGAVGAPEAIGGSDGGQRQESSVDKLEAADTGGKVSARGEVSNGSCDDVFAIGRLSEGTGHRRQTPARPR